LVPFKRGRDDRRNVAGRRPIGESVIEAINRLGSQSDDGSGLYSVSEIRRVLEAPEGDHRHPIAERIAARWLTECLLAAKRGREAIVSLMARSIGHPRIAIDIDTSQEKRLIILDGREWGELLQERRAMELAELQEAGAPALPAVEIAVGDART
jgi:hypothetical protein